VIVLVYSVVAQAGVAHKSCLLPLFSNDQSVLRRSDEAMIPALLLSREEMVLLLEAVHFIQRIAQEQAPNIFFDWTESFYFYWVTLLFLLNWILSFLLIEKDE
jgi:hypothetical protein